MTDIKTLKRFVEQGENIDGKVIACGDYWWSVAVPCYDFNKEIVEPGTNETFPDGAIGLRVDDDFWAVAALPYKFRDLQTRDIVDVLFPWIPEGEVRIND